MSARSNLSFSDSEIRRKAIAPLPQENASPPPPEGVMKLMQQDKKANKASDDKINQQFRYFRKEFSEAASACGIAMPLAFSEDTSGRVFSFVKHSGPEFILQMLLTETDSLHLMRTSLSLLIVTVSILRRKVPISDTNGLFSSGLFSSSFSEAMSEWAHGALRHLIDGGAVSVCINLLLSTYVQDVQELIITLIAHFVTSSNEAAFQMLQTPNSLGQMELPSYKPNKLPETPSELMDAEIPEHRREAAFVKEKLGDWVDYRKPGNSANNNSNSNIGNYVNSDLVYLEKMKRTSNNNGSASNSNNTSNGPPTCLSYLLSVCALYHNRLVVMSSCAEVIIAMTMAFEDPFFSQQVAATSTCCLPTSEDLRSSNGGNFARNSRSMRKNANSRSSTNVSSGANGSQSRPGTSTTTPSLTNQSNSRRNSLNNQKGPVRISSYGLMEWAGLKLLLKCLHRIQLCQGVSEFSDPSKSSKSDLLPGLLPTQTMTPPTTRNELELSHTHLHVLTAVMLLASRSSFVARYVIELPGAEALMKVSLDSLQAQNMVGKKLASIANDCAQALMEAHNTKQCEQYQSNNSVKSTRSMGSKRDVNANAKSMMIRRGTQINLSGNNVGFGAPLLLSTTYSDESNANTRSNYDDQMSDRDDYSDSGSPTVVTSDAQLEFESLTRKNVSKVRMNENNEAARAKLNTITDSYESDDGNVSDSSERQKRRLQLQLERQTSQRISRNASNKSKNSDYRPFQNFGRACSNEAHASTKTSEMRKEFNLKMFSSKSGDIGDDSSAGGGSSVGGGFGRMSSVCSNKSASTPGKSSVVSTSCGSSLSEVLKLDALRPIVPAPYRPSTVQGVGRQDSVNYSRYGIANHADDICSNDSAPGNLLTGSPARLEPLHSPTALTTQGFLSRKNYPTLVSPTADKQFESIANNALKKLYKKGYAIQGKSISQLERATADYYYASDKLPHRVLATREGTAKSTTGKKNLAENEPRSGGGSPVLGVKPQELWEGDLLRAQLESSSDNCPELLHDMAPKYELHIESSTSVTKDAYRIGNEANESIHSSDRRSVYNNKSNSKSTTVNNPAASLEGSLVDILDGDCDDMSSIGSLLNSNNKSKIINNSSSSYVSAKELLRSTHSTNPSILSRGNSTYCATDRTAPAPGASSRMKRGTPAVTAGGGVGSASSSVVSSASPGVSSGLSRFLKPHENDAVSFINGMSNQSMEIQF